MELPLQPMSLSEYAAMHRDFGAKVVCQNGFFWRRIRPFFYRPLLPLQGFARADVSAPAGWPTGFQYVLSGKEWANSTMNFLILDKPAEYSLAILGRRRRQLIKQAARRFQVRPLRDLHEFKEHGFLAYKSFYERTRYSFKSDRRKEPTFHEWAESVFRHPKAILLAGYGPNGLAAISRSYWVDHTLVYLTYFCETESMKGHLGELMFHELRMLAAQEPQIHEIFVRSYQGGNSLDQYYMIRGCKLVRKPARLEMPAVIDASVRWFMPRKYSLLCGKA